MSRQARLEAIVSATFALAATSLVLACSCSEPPPAESTTAISLEKHEPRASAPGSSSPSVQPRARMPEPGHMRILVLPTGIVLQANQVERSRVLRALSRNALFDLELGELEPEQVTLDLDRASMQRVLAELLAGLAYSSDYALNQRGEHRLAWLSVGNFPEVEGSAAVKNAGAARDRPDAPGPQARRRLYLGWLAKRFRAHGIERLDARAEQAAERNRALVDQLERGDEEARVAAIAALDPDGPEIARIAAAASSDDSVAVRLEALDALGESESYEAMRGLIGALSDQDPVVVARALEVLGEIGDPTVAPYLPPELPDRSDPPIQQALKAFWDDIE